MYLVFMDSPYSGAVTSLPFTQRLLMRFPRLGILMLFFNQSVSVSSEFCSFSGPPFRAESVQKSNESLSPSAGRC